MNKEKLLEEISDPNFDLQYYTAAAEKDKDFRDFIVDEMLNHKQIMVYYHCYYIAEAVSESSPELMYEYWDGIEKLLKHKNSYHRNFALSILARLSKVDADNKMNNCIDDYLSLLDDVKFMTANDCIQNCALIAVYKPELSEKIVQTIIDYIDCIDCIVSEKGTGRNERQLSFLAGSAIESFGSFYENYENKKQMIEFAESNLNGDSPKTRKIAKAFLKSVE
ncbi:hypothetical protein MmiHf6_10570 [Methanimicrococcus hongohii]|uniref:Uncharacterized protein n=1 Tax=Methanimicrococcus hongohii TaxID=3028295 RepID=A0AA96UZT9_9EURY|nr:hypothetical protein [Methanimicrococcus sp. Hf6]WNY23742.1 hypothetical protein MmiHf6_10570 [Methanimicrococcus sp. Hf6]